MRLAVLSVPLLMLSAFSVTVEVVDQMSGDETGTARQMVRYYSAGHFLLPHERWMAVSVWKRQAKETFTDSYLNVNYGPEGKVLGGAALAWGFPGIALGMVVAAPFGISTGSAAFPVVAGIALVFIMIGVWRGFQADRAGKRFRAMRSSGDG